MKSFVGLSLGVWGFIAMFRSITFRDTALVAASFGLLKYLDLGDVLDMAGGMDEDGLLLLLVVVAAALLLVALYFLAEILLSMPGGEVASIVACVVALRIVDVLNDRRSEAAGAERIEAVQRNLAELSLHVFVKGWVGAFLMLLFALSPLPMAWVYLAWSYAHDLLLREWLWRRLAPRLAGIAPVPAAGP